MSIIFFKSNKPKICSEIVNNDIKFNINYARLNNSQAYKFELLRKIINKGVSLVVLNTKYMYPDQKEYYLNHIGEILLELNKFKINYKKVTINRESKVSIFGMPLRQGDNAKMYEDYVIGFMVKNEDIENINGILNRFNPHYFVSCDMHTEEEIFSIFEENSDNEEKIKCSFLYSIIDDIFLKNIFINSKKENAEFISGILK